MKKYTSNTRSITALPRSKRLRQAGVSATAVQSAAYESGDWLPRSVWDSVFTVADDGTLRVRTDLLVSGGVTIYGDGGASGGSGGVIVVDGLESTMTDAALSANMGRVLKDLIDSKSTVTTWAQLEGKPTTIAGFGITDAYTKAQTTSLLAGYLTTEAAAATYVTLATEQTLTGAKTFSALATFAAGATVSADQTLTVGGVTLSRHSDGTLFVDGNIVVSGGVTIYGDGGASGGSGGVVVVDGLESTMTDAALSANMGRVLKELIDSKSTVTTWAQLEGKPTTIAGFGITDAYTQAQTASLLAGYLPLYGGTLTGGLTVQTGGIWVQGGSAAGGDNTRMTLTAGMPSDLAYNGGKRGLRLYSNAIALADPYNGNSNNDAGWIRHLETTANSGTLEIAVGDDATENIVLRQYNTNSQVTREAYLLNGSGDTSFPGKVTAASIYTNGYVYSNSGWFQCNSGSTGLFNAAGDARFSYELADGGWRADKKITAPALYSYGIYAENVYHSRSAFFNNIGECFIRNGSIDGAQNAGGTLANLVIASWYGVSFTTSCGGMAYSGTNAVSIDCRNGHLYVGGNMLSLGGITMYSDLRKKTLIDDVELRLDEIADAPLFSHIYKDDGQKTLHVGSSAQYWDALCPGWFTREDSDGYYMMEIQNCALAAAISLGREVRRYESKTDKQIRKLKRRIAELEEQIEEIKNTNQQNNA